MDLLSEQRGERGEDGKVGIKNLDQRPKSQQDERRGHAASTGKCVTHCSEGMDDLPPCLVSEGIGIEGIFRDIEIERGEGRVGEV